MRLVFRGKQDDLTSLLNQHGIFGDWNTIGYQKQYRTDDGAVINWYPSKGTVMVQGAPQAAQLAKVRLQKILSPRGSAAGRCVRDWSEINFGKYKGQHKTWPEIALSDPDYIYHMRHGHGRHLIKPELELVAYRASRIRIPTENPELWEIRHYLSDEGWYSRFEVARKKTGKAATAAEISDVIDLSAASHLAPGDRYRSEKLVTSFKRALGKAATYAYSRVASELFFERDQNFVLEE
jgi:hypothetical protein